MEPAVALANANFGQRKVLGCSWCAVEKLLNNTEKLDFSKLRLTSRGHPRVPIAHENRTMIRVFRSSPRTAARGEHTYMRKDRGIVISLLTAKLRLN